MKEPNAKKNACWVPKIVTIELKKMFLTILPRLSTVRIRIALNY